jgi:hypothetical protein
VQRAGFGAAAEGVVKVDCGGGGPEGDLAEGEVDAAGLLLEGGLAEISN